MSRPVLLTPSRASSWWRRIRCAHRGHPTALSVTLVDGTHNEWCACGKPAWPNFYTTDDGRTFMRGRGPEPWR